MVKSQPNNTPTCNSLKSGNIDIRNNHCNQLKINKKAMENFLRASPEDLAEANRRYQVIEPYLDNCKRDNEVVPERTIRRWKARYKAAQQACNCGYIGLLDNHHAKGNRSPKISQISQDFIDKIIEEHYETFQQKGKLAVYGILAREWDKAGLTDKQQATQHFVLELNTVLVIDKQKSVKEPEQPTNSLYFIGN